MDAYIGALDAVATAAGADLIVSEDAKLDGDHFDLTETVADARSRRQLAQVKLAAPASLLAVPDHLVLYKDPLTGAFIIIAGSGKASKSSSALVYPRCAFCPAPKYQENLREHRREGRVVLLATIDTRGVAEYVGVLRNPDPDLSRASRKAVRGWRFKPARLNGVPIPIRIPIEVTFQFLH